jgi:hypothetical protein
VVKGEKLEKIWLIKSPPLDRIKMRKKHCMDHAWWKWF